MQESAFLRLRSGQIKTRTLATCKFLGDDWIEAKFKLGQSKFAAWEVEKT